jgi:hypothetical protein
LPIRTASFSVRAARCRGAQPRREPSATSVRIPRSRWLSPPKVGRHLREAGGSVVSAERCLS